MAVRIYGPGHVVAYNYVANFHDGIDIETYGNPDGSHAIDGPHYPPRRVLGAAAGGDRFLQQLHDELSRQRLRDRRQHAQRPRDAKHDDQLRLASDVPTSITANSMAGIWPMFGVANQMLAVIALAILSSYLTNAGRAKYLWVTVLPMLFVLTTTNGTAGIPDVPGQLDAIFHAVFEMPA